MSREVVVVGGGLIGLASAWRGAQRGFVVTVVDPSPGRGSSHVAAGMLAPVTEVHYGEEPLLELTVAAARRWPAFADELEDATGVGLDHQRTGTLLVGLDDDDRRVLDDLHRFQQQLGLEVQRLRSRECRRHEPLLSPRIRGGVLAGEDHRVDPRKVVTALQRACRDAGVRSLSAEVARVEHDDRRVTGVTLRDGDPLRADAVVLAAGAATARIAGLPPEVAVPVRPVKGQLLRLRSRDDAPVLARSVRGLVRGRSVYLVPRSDGEVVVGATQEELGHDTAVTAGGVRELLDAAAAIVPGVDELVLEEALAGLRPGTPDGRPLIGATPVEGLVLATGHHRNGVLLTPITAEAVVAVLRGEAPPAEVATADPRRAGLDATPAGTGPRRDA